MSDWPSGVDRRVYNEIDSTMSEAARLAPDIAGPTWVFAHQQTAARGRRGRAWVHPKGNFSATLIYRPEGPIEARAQRSFVAALALADALDSIIGPGMAAALSLKWPNDVLLNGGKIAGILLESRDDFLSVGIGVNLVAHPEANALEPGATGAVDLAGETGHRVDPQSFLSLLAAAYAKREAEFTTFGFSRTRAAWLARAARLGEVITARTQSTEITGRFEDIDNSGQIVLSSERKLHVIPAAEIFF